MIQAQVGPIRGVDVDRSSDYPWFAVAVRPSMERSAYLSLGAMGMEYFRATRTVRRQWSDRLRVVEEPLFPGYLFCKVDLNNRMPVLRVPGVISIVGSGRTMTPVDPAEIEAIRVLCNSGLRLSPLPYLKKGQRVRIEGGVLAGVEGILCSVRNEYRVVVSVTMLQRSVSVEIDLARLRML